MRPLRLTLSLLVLVTVLLLGPAATHHAIVMAGPSPTVHHGCWATVILQDQRVNQVRYRFVPSSVDASNDCEEIFANCPE